MSDYLTMVVHGEAKVGKTWLGASAPKPVLILDSEAGGFRFVPGKKIDWDPMREDPPAAGEWEICRVAVNDTITLDTVVQWLQSGKHPFRSVVFDSLTEFQARLKREINATGDLEQRDWGRILIRIEDLVMMIRDCVDRQEDLTAFIAIAGSHHRDGKMRPMMQGAIKDKLSYKLDGTGYLFTAKDAEGHLRRGLRMIGDGQIDAGNRFGGVFPEVIWDPNVEDMLNTLAEGSH